MIDLAQNGVSHEEALAALTFPGGQRGARFELHTLRGGVRRRSLRLLGMELRCLADRPVKYSGMFEVMDDPYADWREDLLQPVFVLSCGGKELRYPFPQLRPALVRGSGRLSVTARDGTCLLEDSSVGERLYIPAGTRYTQFVEAQLKACGFHNMLVEPSEAVLAFDREDWEPETSRLTLCNALLSEIGYRSLEAGRDGLVRSGPYRPPGERECRIHYRADGRSVILDGCVRENDCRLRPNRFVGYVSHPNRAPLRAVYENTDPASAHSPGRNGGYVITAVKQFMAADISALQTLVRRWAVESDQRYEHVTLRTAPMPHHEVLEQVALDCAQASGVYTETGWVIRGGVMIHTLRRLSDG